jgi:acetylornithine deacetylase/succinyl-diaminopimelate desuccinylase-like protein
LLTRIEDEARGTIKLDDLYPQIPPERLAQAKAAAEALGDKVWTKFPFAPGVTPVADNLAELILNRTWRPTLSVTGLGGAPEPINAGNVLRPYTEAKLSIRLPPTVDAPQAGERIKRTLEADPPYGAEVRFELEQAATGWNAPKLAPWLEGAVHHASSLAFGRQAAMMGEGGSIPFMAMLGAKFPKAQFVVTGVLGPHSNAHGPNEFLHLAYARRITTAIAVILAHHASSSAPG